MNRRSFLLATGAALTPVAAGAFPSGKTYAAYPSVVVAAGKQAVYDLQTICGARVPISSMTLASALGLPAANGNPVVYRTAATSPAKQIEPNAVFMAIGTGTNSFSQVNLKGAGIFVYNNGVNLTLTDCYLNNNNGNFLRSGLSDGASQVAGVNAVSLNYCTLDYTGAINTNAQVSGNYYKNTGSSFTYDHCWFNNASRGFWQSTCTVTMTWCFIGGFNQNPGNAQSGPSQCVVGSRDHAEAFKHNGGTFLMQNCFVNGAFLPVGNTCISDYTALCFWTSGQAGESVTASAGSLVMPADGEDINATVDNCILYGGGLLNTESLTTPVVPGSGGFSPPSNPLNWGFFGTGLLYPIQAKASLGFNTTVTVKNTLIQKGGSLYATAAMQGYLALTGVTGTFNVGDTVTGGTSGAQAQVSSYNSSTGLLIIITLNQLTSNVPVWNGTFLPNETVSGAHGSGTTGVSNSVLQNVAQFVDGGGNIDWATGRPVNIVTGVLS